MTDELLKTLRLKLAETLETLHVTPRSSLELLVERSAESTEEAQAEAIESERIEEWELRVKVSQRIQTALDRMDSGEYGKCADCGEVIADKRLEAVPWAARCLACQEKREATSDLRPRAPDEAGHFRRLANSGDLLSTE